MEGRSSQRSIKGQLKTNVADQPVQNDCVEKGSPAASDPGEALDAVLSHVGEMGTYQILLFLCLLPLGCFWAFSYFGQMFLVATPQEHWCRVPELADLDLELRRYLSIPQSSPGEWENCRRFDANWTEVLSTMTPPDADTPLVPCTDGWEFLFEDIPYSTVTSEREWVCDRASLVPSAQAIAFLGSVVGGLFYGWLGDKFGRVPSLVVTNLVGCIGGVATAFTSGFWDFTICRILVFSCCDSCFMVMYILVMEYVGTRHRTWVANVSIAVFFGGGCVLLPFLALWLADWRRLALIMGGSMLLAGLAPLVVPESTRWLSSKGKVDRAVSVLRRFEVINRRKIPGDVLDQFIKVSSNNPEKQEGIMVILKTGWLRLMMVFVVLSLGGCAIVFDVISRLTETIEGNFFYMFAIMSATELPSILLVVLLMDRIGRRHFTFWTFILFAVTALLIIFIPNGIGRAAAAALCRFFINMSYNALLQWTPELLPTPTRVSGAALAHVCAFLMLVAAPFIVYSGQLWEPMPLVSAACLAAGSAALALQLPETSGVSMPQTLLDGERLASTAGFFPKKKLPESNTDVNATETSP